MTSEQEKYVQLVIRLQQGTEQRKIPWEIESDNAVRTTIAGFVIKIAHYEAQADAEALDYFVFIEDEIGNRIDSFVDTDLHRFATESFHAYRELDETYQRARRQALGADVALDAILEALSDGE